MPSLRTFGLIIVSVALGVSGPATTLPAVSAGGPAPDRTGPAAVSALSTELQRLTDHTARLAVRPGTGNVTFIGGSSVKPLQRPNGDDDDPGQTARRFVNRYAPMFGISDGQTQLTQSAVFSGDAGDAVRFQQRVSGIPVIAGQIAVQIDSGGAVVSSSGEASPRLSVDLQATVPAEQAAASALAVTARADATATDQLTVSTPDLWVFDPALIGSADPLGPRLVWRMQVRTALGEVNRLVLVDAHTGTIALHFTQVEAALNRQVCDRHNVRGASEICSGSIARAEGDPPSPVTSVNNAYDHTGETYNFFWSKFGRDSVDDGGMPLISTVRYCPGNSGPTCVVGTPSAYENAFWNGAQMVYGDGFEADDVVGHELTHAVTDFTSGLFYFADSGAINESMSDVMGELIDQSYGIDNPADRWLLGEDLPIGVLRSMKNPPEFGDPDRMTSQLFAGSIGDNYGVHSNSGVNNKAAFLMSDGGTFNQQTIAGLGAEKTAQIYYAAETTLLTPGSDYQDLGRILPQACTNLIGSLTTAMDCQEIYKIVLATEMDHRATTTGAALAAPLCAGAAVQTTTYFSDNMETNNASWSLSGPGESVPWRYSSASSQSAGSSLNVPDLAAPPGASVGTTSTLTQRQPVAIPTSSYSYLRFDHSFATDWDDFGLYGGGVVEYSTDGTSWIDISGLDVVNGYVATLDKDFGNPFSSRPAFGTFSPNYETTRVDLRTLGGKSVRFRFRFGADTWPSGDFPGWFIDDLSVYSCAEAPGPPTSVAAIASDQAATVTWSPPQSAGGSPVTGYVVTPVQDGVGQTAIEIGAASSSLTVGNLVNRTTYSFTVAARNEVGLGAPSLSNSVLPTPPDFAPLVPARLLDSRPGQTTIDGRFNGIGRLAPLTSVAVTVTGRGGVAPDAGAVALNVTVTDAQGAGYLTVYPCGQPPPTASNLNYVAGSTIPNAVVSKVGTNGQVCFVSQSAVHLVVDANGFFPQTSSFVPLTPARLLDSRAGQPTADGQFSGIGQRTDGIVTEIQVAGRAGLPLDASAAVLNVTVTEAQAPGYATVYPCAGAPPTASNLNYVRGSTIPNAVVAKIGVGGKVCVFTQSAIQLVVDVSGYFPAASHLTSLVPARLLDSRRGQSTSDGQSNGIGVRAPGGVTTVLVVGRAGIPIGATSAVLNVTVTEAQAPGYATVYPCGGDPPTASNLNYVTGSTIPNAVIVKIGISGTVCVYTQSAIHMVVDVSGYFTG